MSEAAVLFCKPGSVRPSDKAALRKAGVVVVEVADPADVRFVRAEGVLGAQELPHGDLLAAAARAVLESTYAPDKFGKAVAQALVARHAKASLE